MDIRHATIATRGQSLQVTLIFHSTLETFIVYVFTGLEQSHMHKIKDHNHENKVVQY